MKPLAAPLILVLASACGGGAAVKDSAPARAAVDPWSVPEPTPRSEPRSRYGNPEQYEVAGRRYRVRESARGYREKGRASWYGTKFHGRRTSSGEPYDMYALTAAHKTLPLPCHVRVTNLENGRQLIVRVNDRGPFHPGRIIDLSYAAAVRLGVYAGGSAAVEVEALTDPGRIPAPQRATDGGRYFLQVGAFRNMDNKNALAADLRRQGIAQVVERQISDARGWTLYRVLLGPFSSLGAVHDTEQHLKSLGYPTIIVPE